MEVVELCTYMDFPLSYACDNSLFIHQSIAALRHRPHLLIQLEAFFAYQFATEIRLRNWLKIINYAFIDLYQIRGEF